MNYLFYLPRFRYSYHAFEIPAGTVQKRDDKFKLTEHEILALRLLNQR